MAESKQIDKYNYMPFGTAVIDVYRSLPSTAKMLANSFVGKENITDQNVSKYFSKEDLSVVAELAEKQQSLIDEGKIDARLGQDSSRPNEEYEKGNTKVDATLGQILNKGNSAQLLNYTEHDTDSLILPQFAPLNPSGKELKDFTQQEKDELSENIKNRKEVRQELENERIPGLSPIADFLKAPPTYNIANTLGKYYYGPPNLAGQRRITDNYNWHLGKGLPMIQEALTMLKDRGEQKNPESIKWLLETISSNSEGAKTPEINFNAPPPYEGGGWNFDPRTGEYLYSDGQGPSSQNTGTADPTWGDYPSEDPGYYDEDIDFKGGGQISQGLDNLYMNKRDSKQKLHNMMGFQSRQYGGGLDDAYMNSRSAFANPNANTAFANPNDPSAFIPDRFPVSSNKAGGLPTIYRANGGDFDFMDSYNQADIDAAMADPTDDGLGGVGGDGGLPGGSPAPAPAAPQGGDANFNTSGFPTDPNAGVFGRPGQTFSQIKGRLDGDKPDDGYTEVEYTYLNDIMAKTGMTISKAENYLASMMATPGGIAAMEKGFYDGYTGGGPAGTLDNFARGVSDNLGIQEIFKRDKKNKEEEDLLRDQAQGIEPSIFNSIKDKVMTYFKGNKGLETEESKQEFQDMLSREGATFEPIQKNMTQTAFGIANSALNPLSPIASILEFVTGATPMGTVISKEGVRFALDTTGTLTPEAFLMNAEVDYGKNIEPERRRRPIEQKITETVTEEEKESTPKDNNSPQIKASNIDKLKSYMNLTRKDLSTSKKDLAITDISITEKDFT